LSRNVTEAIMETWLMADHLPPAEPVAHHVVVRPDAPLIVRAQAGDAWAFEQIVITHQRRIIALAWRLLGNNEDARDAAQETFLRVYKHLHKFDPAQDFSGWLYRIAVNVCRDLGRKRCSQQSWQTSFEAELAAGNLIEPASSHDTEAATMLAQEQMILLRALATLTEKERAAIVLRDLEGLSSEEVARILGSSQTTVRSQISTGRVKLKRFRAQWLQKSNQYRER
jgi:RNA polymerase sigma-70 factor, ECF subfamily